MFGTRWQILRLRGIPVSIDLSWLVIVALLSWTLTNQFHGLAPTLDLATCWAMGVIATLTFFCCIVLHEMGHALVARRTGIPLRGITLFLFGGVAQLEGEPTSAGREFAMAIAGPAVSAVLAGFFLALASIGEYLAWPVSVLLVLHSLWSINLLVLAFNMVPAFPLDGGRVLRSILWGAMRSQRRATYWAAMLGRGFAWILIGLGVMSFFFGDYVGGIWLGLIGLFLSSAAAGSYRQVIIREALRGEPVARFMNRQPIVVPPGIDLRQLVEDYVYRYHYKVFPVGTNGHVEGIITTRDLARFPREEWERHTVHDVMNPDIAPASIHATADAFDALERMQRTGSTRLLVLDDHGELAGIVSLKDLLRFLELKLELEQPEERQSLPPRYWPGPRHDDPAGAARDEYANRE